MEEPTLETVAIGNSRFGKGIFAMKDFPAGSVLLKITGSPLSFHDTISLGEKECYCLQTGIDKYIIPDLPFRYSNHSCSPNCGINKNFELITLRPLRKGEEITWDYSTSMLERSWTMECDCQTA